jgi:hypothetical protein
MSYELRYISRHLNVQIWKVCPLTLRNYGFYPCNTSPCGGSLASNDMALAITRSSAGGSRI